MSTRRASAYAQVSAAVRAMKSKMLSRDGYDFLLRCSSSSECMSILREEGYLESTLETGAALDPYSWQSLLDNKMPSLIQKLTRLCPHRCGQLLTEFQNQYRLESLKSALRLMISPEEGEAFSATVGPSVQQDVIRSAVESRNVELLVQVAGAPGLYGEISSALAEKRPTSLIEAVIDRYALTRLWSATDMRDSMDEQSARPLVGEHIDAANLLLAARSRALGLASEEAQRILVPVDYRLGGALTEAATSGSTTNALRAFTRTVYGGTVAAFLETFREGDPLHPLEMSLRRRHAASCLSAFSGFPFSVGLPLAFCYLMSYEVSDLRSIISGKQDGVATERIKDFLIL